MPLREFSYSGGTFDVTDKMKSDFEDAGYIMVRGLLDTEDLGRIREALENNQAILANSFGVGDGEGRESKLCLWNHPGSDVTGMVARCEKVAGTAAQLLGGEVYHYHTKLMMKEALTGGKHVWHQDYGYWYKNGCLFPDMLTAFISLDPCQKSNGCLQILEGSQKCGRIEHIMVDGQTGADMERVHQLEGVLEHLYVEMQPGDALFFHSNLLHTSSANDSPQRRWAFLCAYNTKDNNPVKKHHHPQYTPLSMVSNDAVKQCQNFTDLSGKDFLNPDNDKTTVGKKAEQN